MAATLQGLNPALMQAFQSLVAASPFKLGISSGFRTRAQQQQLYNDYLAGKGNLAAPPGQSNHETGNAIDIEFFDNPQAIQWVHQNAARFGLHFPVRGENWHAELIDGEAAPNAGLDQDALAFNLTMNGAPQNPEDVLVSRIDSIMEMVTGGTPEMETPEAGMASQIGMDTVTVPSEAPAASSVPAPGGGGIKDTVRQMAAEMGWGDQWGELHELVQRESSWNPDAQNPTSSAYGLFQFLDQTWENYGQKTSDPVAQARAGLSYIKDRYGDPRSALAFHTREGWY